VSFVTPLIHPPEGPLARVFAHGQAGAKWVLAPERTGGNPQLFSPGILWDVEPGSYVHRTELFGPVMAVLCARDLEHGLSIMNATSYGLTAGFFGLSESEQERFVAGMDAGNLYINRAITGAVVGRQPFGGRKASSFGPGAKAGGPGYVLQFCHVRPRAGTTRSLARGPLPELSQLLPERTGTPVVGEANWLRYQPAPIWLLVGSGTSELELLRVRRALELAGAHAQQLSLDGDDWIEELGQGHIRRARVLGHAPEGLLARAAELDITLIVDPVEDDPAVEIRHYVQEQTVSVSYHRYGNLSLGDTHPLVGPLQTTATARQRDT
jgi:RHH-type proline utilization regulon transcriptional repressor/proline dehydrogenase/delta 1-pyrroline-5-carboxylate dehydrogenase